MFREEGIIIAASAKHHGIALWPPPSNDPNDPLRWRKWLKIFAIISVSLFNFTANFAGAGFSVATPVLQKQFHKTANEVNTLLTVSAGVKFHSCLSHRSSSTSCCWVLEISSGSRWQPSSESARPCSQPWRCSLLYCSGQPRRRHSKVYLRRDAYQALRLLRERLDLMT